MNRHLIAAALLALGLGGCSTIQQAGSWVADRSEGAIDTAVDLNRSASRVALKELCEGMRLSVYRDMFPTPEKQAAHNALCTPVPLNIMVVAPKP